MVKRFVAIAAAAALAACQTTAEPNVKSYTARSGETVVAGEATPKSEYSCQKLSTEKQLWGAGVRDRVAAEERITRDAVDAAPSKGANYVNVMPPVPTSLGSINVNAFADARVEYYRCANLPPAK